MQRQDRASASTSCSPPSSTASRRPRATPTAPLQALVFDSHYDDVPRRDHLRPRDERHGRRRARRSASCKAGTTHEVLELGQFAPQPRPCDALHGRPGRLPHLQHQVARRRAHRRHGHRCPATTAAEPLPGYKEPQADGLLRPVSRPTARTSRSCATRSTSSRINDPSFAFEPETSDALGFGFRCGFLGLLHMEIIQQRLEGESRPRPGADRPERHLRDPHARRRDARTSTTRRTCPTPARSRSSASRSSASTSSCRPSTSAP